MNKFIGRRKEIEKLCSLRKKKASSLVVVWGRRRIGKSRLIQEFMNQEKAKSFSFTGLAPEKNVTAQAQREEFVRQLATQGVPGVSGNDWGDIFWHLSKQVESGDAIILFDEISWMGSKDPLFLGKLKNAWDLYFKKNPNLILILCGSVSTWIEENLINSTGFLGRFSLYLHLDELPLHRCNEFFGRRRNRISPYEKFKLLSVTGGVPRYLEEIDPTLTADQNIHRLCFSPGGILVHEFDRIFHDLFSRRGPTYKKLIRGLINKNCDQKELLSNAGIEKGGSISSYLDDLVKTGFISRDFTWDIKNGKESKLSHFRLRDNYLRFYLKCIEPVKDKILKGKFEERSLSRIIGWDTIMGLQFENLVVYNDNLLLDKLNIDVNDIKSSGPFFQTASRARKGCQIDYMVQTTHGILYLFEVKFSRNTIGMDVVKEIEEKIRSLKTPKNFSFFPVLIHIGEVSGNVIDSGSFVRTIDFCDFLDSSE